MWPRFGRRLRTKAKQTGGSEPSWIRIDESGGLIALTQAGALPLEQRLGWLSQNTTIELQEFPH